MTGKIIDMASEEARVLSLLKDVTTEQIKAHREEVFKKLIELGKGDFTANEMKETTTSVAQKMSITDIKDYLVKVGADRNTVATNGGTVNEAMKKVLKEKQSIV